MYFREKQSTEEWSNFPKVSSYSMVTLGPGFRSSDCKINVPNLLKTNHLEKY